MAVRKINESTLTAIGNAIRAKTGGSALITPEDMASEIGSIPSGGSSERVFTKLAEYTVTEPVSQITIPETEQMQGCECLYIRAIDVALSAADWIYPVVNNSYITSGGMGYTDKVSTWNAYLRLLQSFKNSVFTQRVCFFSVRTLSVSTARFIPYDDVTTIDFKLYTSGVTFNSGTIEIWGYV